MTREVTVPRARLGPWLTNFGSRHGSVVTTTTPTEVILDAPDGAQAVIGVPFPPLTTDLVTHVARDRRVGILLVRKGGHAVGVAVGERLVASKVDSGYVQGRTKAGGWSQQRYARRRDNQAQKAYAEAADTAARLLLPEVRSLAAVVTGGDAPAVRAVLADPRLSALEPLVLARVYPVVDPRLRVLQAFPETYLSVSIALNDLA